MRKISYVFVTALISNIVWENLHSFLYEAYKGGTITEYILIRASLFDALIITLILVPFLYFSFFTKRSWLILLIGTIVAIVNEWYGLGSGRWVYNSLMPILPILKIGVTPALQLGLLGYITYRAVNSPWAQSIDKQ